MKISTKGRYALRMMLDIAAHQANGYVALKEVADRQDISKKYLEQIALHLSQAGMLRAVRGFQGGYMLTREAKDYTVGQILDAVEGSICPVACLERCPNPCQRAGDCATLPLWEGLQRVIQNYLNGVTLQDVLDGKIPE